MDRAPSAFREEGDPSDEGEAIFTGYSRTSVDNADFTSD
jgi:hypothetical protein